MQTNNIVAQCFGLSTIKKSTPKILATITKQSSSNNEKINDYSPAYELQKNNINLQKAQRSMLNEMIRILLKSSTDIKKWKDKWYQFFEDQRDDIISFTNIWNLFGASISATDIFIEQINESIDKLKDTKRIIPKPDKQQLLKFKVTQARFEVDKIRKELDELKSEEIKLGQKICRLESRISRNDSPNNDCQTPLDELNERQRKKQISIENKEKLLQKQIKIFYVKQDKLYDESKKIELKRCQLLKKQSNAFVESLNIKSNEFLQLFENFIPKNDLIQWEKEYIKQLDKSQSIDDENPNKKTKHINNSSSTDSDEE